MIDTIFVVVLVGGIKDLRFRSLEDKVSELDKSKEVTNN